MTISNLAIKRPVTIVMIFIGFAIVGIFAAFRLPLEMFPDQESPYVGLAINIPSTNVQELERSVTRPVEEILSTMSGIERMFSYTRTGYVRVGLTLHADGDVLGKGIEARDLIESIRHLLPDEFRRVELRNSDNETSPVMNVLIVAEGLDMDQAYDFLDVNVRAVLERLPGVNSVNLYGIVQNNIRILLDQDRIAAHGLNYRDIQSRLQQENFYVSAGTFETRQREFRVNPMGRYESLDSIRLLPLNDKGLVLNDVAEVILIPDDEMERRRVNGEKSLGVSVYKRSEANLVEMSRVLARAMEKIKEKKFFENMQFFSLDSQADAIIESLNDLRDSGFMGGILSVFVLFLFLRQVNVSLLIASSVPLAICATLGLMYFLGMTLNILSLVGLMLTIGLLVDNSVVVSEAISIRRQGPRNITCRSGTPGGVGSRTRDYRGYVDNCHCVSSVIHDRCETGCSDAAEYCHSALHVTSGFPAGCTDAGAIADVTYAHACSRAEAFSYRQTGQIL